MAHAAPTQTAPSDPASDASVSAPVESAAKAGTQAFDFRQPTFLSASDQRKLRNKHEEFARSLSARLSIYLRMECALKMPLVKTVLYQKFVESLGSPTHLTLFKLDPLRGICVLEVPSRLGLAVVDRLLGGPGVPVGDARELSEIEVALLDQVAQIILSEWSNQWLSLQDMRPLLLGHESHGRFLQTSPQDNIVLVLSFETRLGELTEKIQIGFPHHTVEPLIRHFCASMDAGKEDQAPPAAPRVQWKPQFDDVPVEITAELHGPQLAARAVAHIKVGDILPLAPAHLQRVRVQVGDQTRFLGRLGTSGAKWAVELAAPVHE